jgi:hypothetical protein
VAEQWLSRRSHALLWTAISLDTKWLGDSDCGRAVAEPQESCTLMDSIQMSRSSVSCETEMKSVSLESAVMEENKCLGRQSYTFPAKPLDCLRLGHWWTTVIMAVALSLLRHNWNSIIDVVFCLQLFVSSETLCGSSYIALLNKKLEMCGCFGNLLMCGCFGNVYTVL